MFNSIVMIDYAKPLAQRKRVHTGPYRWTPDDRRDLFGRNKPCAGRGFYMGDGVRVDARGSTFDLRIDYANTHKDGVDWRRSGTFSHDGHDTFTAIVARLPHGRGFLAGWTLGRGMASSLDGHIWATIEEAASAAYDEAERACESDAEFQAQQNEELDNEE